MGKIQQTKEELQQSLDEQIELLKALCDLYDNGQTLFAKQIATVVRILVHDTQKSYSLLSQLDLKRKDFFDSCSLNKEEDPDKYVEIGGFTGIVGVGIGPDASYTPYLDEVPRSCYGDVPFDEYWGRTILKDTKGSTFTRKDIVLTVANQDGGAHVDPEIDEKYASLVRKNSMGWVAGDSQGRKKSLTGIELATIRQIGHEILRTLDRSLPRKNMLLRGAAMIIGGIRMGYIKSDKSFG